VPDELCRDELGIASLEYKANEKGHDNALTEQANAANHESLKEKFYAARDGLYCGDATEGPAGGAPSQRVQEDPVLGQRWINAELKSAALLYTGMSGFELDDRAEVSSMLILCPERGGCCCRWRAPLTLLVGRTRRSWGCSIK